MKINWNTAAYQFSQQGKAYVIVTLIGVTGSTPRSSGTKMVISLDEVFDTIGGGHLEHKIIKRARELLQKGITCQHLEHFHLGIHLDQCCGGSANILFECFSANKVNIMVFGAGHVGQALLPILASLPCQITWVDERTTQFPEDSLIFDNVTRVISQHPEAEVSMMPANSYYIVLSHKHQMDFDICQQIFLRDDFTYLGLIGSETKWRRFSRRFILNNIKQELLDKMNCPIGISSVPGKLPAEIAISIASQVIERYRQIDSELVEEVHQGVSWKLIKSQLQLNQTENANVLKKRSKQDVSLRTPK